ncbi:hypothetical protein SOVF_214170, partial [Spinacia oleracea]
VSLVVLQCRRSGGPVVHYGCEFVPELELRLVRLVAVVAFGVRCFTIIAGACSLLVLVHCCIISSVWLFFALSSQLDKRYGVFCPCSCTSVVRLLCWQIGLWLVLVCGVTFVALIGVVGAIGVRRSCWCTVLLVYGAVVLHVRVSGSVCDVVRGVVLVCWCVEVLVDVAVVCWQFCAFC